MSVIVVDDALKAKLLSSGKVVEIHDEAGHVLGQFVTTLPKLGEVRDETGQLVTRFPAPEPTVVVIKGQYPSEEELERRLREEKSYTAEQVMERLRSLREKP
ncbi:MAG TPA: hypothetical protein VM533_15135 [Fimbriiglobus sp.]|jgi:hypothetical protein|nr:hypothetical protein [Fimbriiglobus sp.]